MSAKHDTLFVAAVKTTIINIGAWVTTMFQTTDVTKLAQWLAVAYTLLQFIKAIPWVSAYARALWRGFRHGQWASWWRIADKEEKTNDTAK